MILSDQWNLLTMRDKFVLSALLLFWIGGTTSARAATPKVCIVKARSGNSIRLGDHSWPISWHGPGDAPILKNGTRLKVSRFMMSGSDVGATINDLQLNGRFYKYGYVYAEDLRLRDGRPCYQGEYASSLR